MISHWARRLQAGPAGIQNLDFDDQLGNWHTAGPGTLCKTLNTTPMQGMDFDFAVFERLTEVGFREA